MRRFLAPVLLLAGLGLTQETGYNTNWSGHRTLHINTLANSRTATAISANVVKYPMLVRLGAADSAIFLAAKTDGADVRFTKSNNTTRIQHAIESWDQTNRVATVWVLLDTVYANNQTQNFRMHWGNVGAVDSSKMTAVFDTANGFVAVWHMNGATNTLTDATVNAFNGTAVGNANTNNPQITNVAGMIGRGHDFPASTGNDGTGGGYRITGSRNGALNFPDSGTYTLSAWAFPHSTNEFRSIIGKGDNAWAMHINSGSYEYFQYASIPPGGAWQAVTGSGSATSNNWVNIVGIRKGASSYLYLNGLMIDSTYTNATNAAARIDTADVNIGKWGGAAGTAQTSNDRFFDGVLDEIRVSKVARSADWALLDFASQNPAQSLVTDSASPKIAYTVDSIVAEVGSPIANQLPTILSGVPQPAVSVSPALPAGLSLTTTNNANRGLISGTPTAAQARTMHVITATNDKGTFMDTVYVTVTTNAENYTTWTNMKTMNFTSPAATTVTQYPFLLRLNAADSAVFTGGGNNGASLRFSRTDAIKLKYSIDYWDAVNRRAGIWILMDQVTSGANTLRMHWGNGTATSQSNSQAVFSRANGHVGVWHMGDSTGAAVRPNAVQPGVNDAVPGGSATASMVPITGVIGMADTLRAQVGTNASKGTDDFFYLGNGIRFANYQMSMSMWINLPVTIPTGWNHWIGFGNVAGSDNVWFGRVGSNNNWKARGAANGQESNSDAALVVTNGLNPRPAWAHFAITRSGFNGRRWTMHKDGVQLIDFTGTVANHDLLPTVRDSNFIGRALWGDPNTRGTIDEARVDNVARPAAWYQLDFATQRPGAGPLGTLTYATALKGAIGAAITPAAPSVSGPVLSYTLTGTLPAGIVFNDTTGVISGTPTAPAAATVTVTANSGIWTSTATVSMSFGDVDGNYGTAWSGHKYVGMSTLGSTPNVNTLKLPVLVRLGTADSLIFNASQANGADIRFTKIGDVTRLKHEIEMWDKANKRAAVWVLLDTVYGNSTGSRFRMHYGNATVSDSSKSTAVFDSANGFASVFHMGGTNNTNARPNAVAGGNVATPSNLTTDAVKTGVIGLADSLGVGGTNGTGSYLSFGPVPVGTITTGKATLSAWIKKTAWAVAWRHAISIGSGAPNNNFWFGTTGEELGALRVRTAQGTTEQTAINASGAWVDETWQHVQVAYEPTGTQSVVYVNGVSVATGDIGHVLGDVARTSAYIGRALWGDDKFTGVFDEVRLQKTTRSADWVKLEYLNQNPASTMVSFTDTQIAAVTGINASASVLGGQQLAFKAMGKGLLFQVHSEAASKVRIAVVDMFGRTVWNRTMTTGAGMNQIVWDGNSTNGMAIGSGIYVVRMNLLDVNGKPAASLTRKVPMTH